MEKLKLFKEPNLWYVLGILILLGLMTNVGLALSLKNGGYLAVLMLYSSTAFVIGSLLGFLFGIPKINVNSSQSVNQNQDLMQISDWFIKLIVGASLVEMHNFEVYLVRLRDFLASDLIYYTIGNCEIYNKNIGFICFVNFAILGFICSYTYTRVFFTRIIDDLEDEMK